MRSVLRTLFNTEGCELCRSILVYGLLCGILLVALIVIGIASSSSLAEREESPPAADGLLSDVVGENVLHKLQVTQAALEREVAFLKGAPLFDGKVSDATSLARALAHVQADQERLAVEVRHLRAENRSLSDGFLHLRALFSEQERMVNEFREGQGD